MVLQVCSSQSAQRVSVEQTFVQVYVHLSRVTGVRRTA